MAGTKLTPALRKHLDASPADELVDVVVELHAAEPPATRTRGAARAAQMEAHRSSFDDAVAPMEKWIQSVGGEVVERAWINQTMRVRLPANCVRQLTEKDGVALVDAPARLHRE